MKWTRKKSATAVAAALAIALLTLAVGRDWIASLSYRRAGERVAGRMSAVLMEKYGYELRYTLDKFWNCYRDGVCSRDDMTDVMDRLRLLGGQDTISDRDVFELIGMISRVYTDRFDEHHRRLMEDRRG